MKKILSEIKRIQEIMGVEVRKDILLEQPSLWKELIDGGKKIWKSLSKERVGSYTNPTGYRVGNIDIAPDTFSRIRNFLENPYSTINNLIMSDAFVLGRILSQEIPNVESLYQSQFRRAMLETGASEEELLQSIADEAVNNYQGDLRLALRNIFANESGQIDQSSELLSGMLLNKIRNRISSLQDETFKTEIVDIEGAVKNWLKNNEPAILKALREIYLNWFNIFKNKDKNWIDNKLTEIESRLQEKLSRKMSSGTPDPQAGYREIRELFNFIVARRRSGQDEVGDLLKLHIDDNPRIPQKLKDELNSFGYVDAIRKRLNKDIVNTTSNLFAESVKRSIESIPILGGILRPIALKAKLKDKYNLADSFMGDFAEATKRFLLSATYRSPFTPTEILARSIAIGRAATIGEKVFLYITFHNYIIPFLYQTLEGLFTNTEIQRLKLIIETVQSACDAGVLVPCPDEDIKKLQNYTKEQFKQGMRDKMPFLDTVRSIKDGDLLALLGSMTWLDEIGEFFGNAWDNLVFGDQTVFLQYMDQLKTANESIEKSLRAMGVDPKDEQQIQKLKESLNKTYKNSLQDFENSFRDAGLSVSPGECQDLGGGKYSYGNNNFIFKVTKPATGEGYFEIEPE